MPISRSIIVAGGVVAGLAAWVVVAATGLLAAPAPGTKTPYTPPSEGKSAEPAKGDAKSEPKGDPKGSSGSGMSGGRPAPAPIDYSLAPEWEKREARRLRNIRRITTGGDRTGESYFSPDGNKIIFQRVPEGGKHYQMYVLDLTVAGAEPKLVSTGKGACTCGHWRPDGKKIIWASTHEDPAILAGREPSEDTVPGYQKGGSNYRWAYPRHMNIYESDPDGSNIRALTTGAFYTAEGSYDKDGKRIVFASDREDGDIELYVMNADGTDQKRITRSPGYDGGPFFSPDARRVLWRSDRKAKDLLQVYTAAADGTDARPLTDNTQVNWGPTWSPDGKWIIFSSSLSSPPGRHVYDLWMMSSTGDFLERITYHPGPDVLPVFSPDGRRLMWTSRREADPKTQIYIADWID